MAAVIFDGTGKVLLGKRKENGLWGVPAGRVEPTETVEEALRREVREETNLEIEVDRLIGVYSDPAFEIIRYSDGEVVHYVTPCFRCTVTGGRLRADGIEFSRVAFFAPNDLPPDLLPMHPRWLSDALCPQSIAFVR